MIAIAVIALPAILWCLFRLILPRGPFEMDHGQVMGSFSILMPYWTRLFFYIATVSLICAIIARGWDLNVPALCLLLAFVNALLFNGFLTLNYENYLATRYPRDGSQGVSSYTINKYALVLALGVSAVLLLLAGLGLAAWSMQ
jgi:hypothetical protein